MGKVRGKNSAIWSWKRSGLPWEWSPIRADTVQGGSIVTTQCCVQGIPVLKPSKMGTCSTQCCSLFTGHPGFKAFEDRITIYMFTVQGSPVLKPSKIVSHFTQWLTVFFTAQASPVLRSRKMVSQSTCSLYRAALFLKWDIVPFFTLTYSTLQCTGQPRFKVQEAGVTLYTVLFTVRP